MIDFDWIIPNELGLSSKPMTIDDISSWINIGIRAVLILVEDHEMNHIGGMDRYKSILSHLGLDYLHLPIRDFWIPPFENALLAVKWISNKVKENKPVVIHCNAGLGRSGLMAACYLIYSRNMRSSEAISVVRENRFGALESEIQVAFVFKFEDILRKKES